MKSKLLTAVALVGVLCMGAYADLASMAPAAGWMSVFENNAGSKGAAVFAQGWGVPDLKTITSDDLTFELFPNVNAYNVTDPFWSNLVDDGNKWMEATTQREIFLVAGQTEASLDFSVSAFDLDSRYNLTVFIKTLDPTAGWGVSAIDSAIISGTAGTTTLSIGSLVEGHVLQIGYQMDGINANPDTDWGSATSTLESVNVIPEPATFGLLGLFGAGLLLFRRRFKR